MPQGKATAKTATRVGPEAPTAAAAAGAAVAASTTVTKSAASTIHPPAVVRRHHDKPPHEMKWFAPVNVPWHRRLQTATMLMWLMALPVSAVVTLTVLAFVLTLSFFVLVLQRSAIDALQRTFLDNWAFVSLNTHGTVDGRDAAPLDYGLVGVLWFVVIMYVLHIATDKRARRDSGRWARFDQKGGSQFGKHFRDYFPAATIFDRPSKSAEEILGLAAKAGGGGGSDKDKAAYHAYLDEVSRLQFPALGSTGGGTTGRRGKVDADDDVSPPSYLFGVHPHGLFGFGVWTSFVFPPESVQRVLPPSKFSLTGHTLAANFNMPLWREFLLSLGFCDVSRETLMYRLTRNIFVTPKKEKLKREGDEEEEKTATKQAVVAKPKGKQQQQRPAAEGDQRTPVCVIVPGGAAESVNCTEPRLTLLHRKGFIKIALMSGAALVPSFAFGETELYTSIVRDDAGVVKQLLKRVQKLLHVGTPLVCGRGVFNYRAGPLPRRGTLVTVVGAPIRMPRLKDPATDVTPKLVDSMHATYVAALTELYNKYQPFLDPKGVHGGPLVVE